MKHILFALLTVLFFSGCASQNSLSPAMQADLAIPIYCEGPDECKVMWKRALRFVSLNAGYKIQKADAVTIETKRARGGVQSTRLSMRVTKSPLGAGRYQLNVGVWCVRGISIYRDCKPDAKETLWRAKLFIREGRE